MNAFIDEVEVVLAALLSAEPRKGHRALHALNAGCELFFGKLALEAAENAIVRVCEARDILIEVETEAGGPQSHCVLIATWAAVTERKIRSDLESVKLSQVTAKAAFMSQEHAHHRLPYLKARPAGRRSVAAYASPTLNSDDLVSLRQLLISGRNFSDWKLAHGLSLGACRYGHDWVTIPETLVDRNDPGCVVRTVREENRRGVVNHFQMWDPTRWVAVAVSLLVPVRLAEVQSMTFCKTDRRIIFSPQTIEEIRSIGSRSYRDSISAPRWLQAMNLLEKLRDWQMKYNSLDGYWKPSDVNVPVGFKRPPLKQDEIFLFRAFTTGKWKMLSPISRREMLASWRYLYVSYRDFQSSSNASVNKLSPGDGMATGRKIKPMPLSAVRDAMLRMPTVPFEAPAHGYCVSSLIDAPSHTVSEEKCLLCKP